MLLNCFVLFGAAVTLFEPTKFKQMKMHVVNASLN